MKKFISEINEFKIYKIAESGQMFRVFHPNDNHRYEDFYSFDNAKTYIENALPELREKKILFEVSGLEPDNSTNALTHYEIEFTQPVNADWLISVIQNAIEKTT